MTYVIVALIAAIVGFVAGILLAKKGKVTVTINFNS
jgi:hypothetical protein